MQISDIHALALSFLNSDESDVEPGKLMSYTNPAILYVNNIRVGAKDPETIKSIVITAPITKPTNFLAYSPPTAVFPLNINGTMIERASGAPPSVVLKYSTKCPRVSNAADTFPMPDEYSDMVAFYIAIRLKKDNNKTQAEEMTMLDRDIQALVKAKGG